MNTEALVEELKEELPKRLKSISPWLSLTKREKLPEEHSLNYIFGKIPSVCAPAWDDLRENPIEWRSTTRSYNLQQIAFKSPDFSSQEEAGEARKIFIENIGFNQVNHAREEYLRISGNKVVFDKPSLQECFTSGPDEDFPNKVPKHWLKQSYLDGAYLRLVRDSAEGYYGRIDGQKQFALIGSCEVINYLRQQNADVRQDLNFSESSEKLARLGTKWAYMGFVYLTDLQAPRYRRAGWPWNRRWDRVPFYVNTESGVEVSPKYAAAKYEVAFIFNPEAMTIRGPEDGIPDITVQDQRGLYPNSCFLYGTITQGTQPRRTEWAYSFLYRRKSTTLRGKLIAKATELWNKLARYFQ